MPETDYMRVHGATVEHEVADVLREYGETYRALHPVTPEQARLMAAIEACRTGAAADALDVGQPLLAEGFRSLSYPKFLR